MKYHSRIRESRFYPDRPTFYVEVTAQSWLSIKLGLADWRGVELRTSYDRLESAQREVERRKADAKEAEIWRKRTKPRYHYL